MAHTLNTKIKTLEMAVLSIVWDSAPQCPLRNIAESQHWSGNMWFFLKASMHPSIQSALKKHSLPMKTKQSSWWKTLVIVKINKQERKSNYSVKSIPRKSCLLWKIHNFNTYFNIRFFIAEICSEEESVFEVGLKNCFKIVF